MAAATIDERGASDATVLEAFETAQPASASWTADDRVWADRVALEALGSDAAPAAFVVGRARHALQRLAPRERIVAQWLREPLWRARWIVVVAVLAFASACSPITSATASASTCSRRRSGACCCGMQSSTSRSSPACWHG